MKHARSGIFFYAVLIVLCIGCKQTVPGPPAQTAGELSKVDSPQLAGASTLDVVVVGPFAFVEKADGLEIWIPEVEGHSQPFAVGIGDSEVRSFERAHYDFTGGIGGSQLAKLVFPVQSADIYQLSRRATKVAEVPKKKPYMTVKLPIPREIVPWNADPMQVAKKGVNPNTVNRQLLATAVILRFDYKEGDLLQMTATSQPTWKPRTKKLGAERMILLGSNPPFPLSNEEEHKHAQIAFKQLTALLGVKLNLAFPAMQYKRNQPLIPGVLPDELLEVLGAAAGQTGHFTRSLPSMDAVRNTFGKTNDCKALVLLVTP
jgi:hypothetical protein